MRWREIDRLGGKLLSDEVLRCAKVLNTRFALDNMTRIPIYRNPTMERKPTRFVPLSAASLHILLALAGDELHGYGIMLEAARQSDGKYKLGPGTLYDNLKKLLAEEISRLEGVLREAKTVLQGTRANIA